jgi:CspA family cold shock protein
MPCLRADCGEWGDLMTTGRVKWFDAEKGYGFITPDGGGPDVFVHQSVLPAAARTLAEGQPVEYEAESTARGSKVTLLTLR